MENVVQVKGLVRVCLCRTRDGHAIDDSAVLSIPRVVGTSAYQVAKPLCRDIALAACRCNDSDETSRRLNIKCRPSFSRVQPDNLSRGLQFATRRVLRFFFFNLFTSGLIGIRAFYKSIISMRISRIKFRFV